MIVDIAEMPYEGKEYSGEEPASVLDIDWGGDVRVERPATYDLRAYMALGELIVEGRIAASLSLLCSRCAESFVFDVNILDFRCVREVGAGVESVDLTDEIRESIILGFPNYPVCSPDCRGLCPSCGGSLNTGACGCVHVEDRRWGALDGLLVGSGFSRDDVSGSSGG